MRIDETETNTPDLGLPPDRWELLVRTIVDDGTEVLSQRREDQRILTTLDAWSRRSVYAPLAVAAAAAALLVWVGPVPNEPSPAPTLTEVIVSTPVAAWLSTDLEVDPLALALALTEDDT